MTAPQAIPMQTIASVPRRARAQAANRRAALTRGPPGRGPSSTAAGCAPRRPRPARAGSATKRPLRPVAEVARGVAEVARRSATGRGSGPARAARAGTLTSSQGRARPASVAQRRPPGREVLEHLAADDQLGRVVARLERLDRRRAVVDLDPGGRGAPARLLDHLGRDVAAAHPQAGAGQADRRARPRRSRSRAPRAAPLRAASSPRWPTNPATRRRSTGFELAYLS